MTHAANPVQATEHSNYGVVTSLRGSVGGFVCPRQPATRFGNLAKPGNPTSSLLFHRHALDYK
jgi:hypothetical protein